MELEEITAIVHFNRIVYKTFIIPMEQNISNIVQKMDLV